MKKPAFAEVMTRRAALMLVGVFVLQIGFIASYIGAFHSPTPHQIPLAVVAPAGAPASAVEQTVEQLNALSDEPLDARVSPSESAARDDLADRKVAGVLLIGPEKTDELLVAGAAGGALSEALSQVITAVDSQQSRTVTVSDAIPADDHDARGLSAFYLAVGWVVGGYLASAILGITAGAKPADRSRASARLIGLAGYALASGLGGALVAEVMFNAFDGGFWELAALGALTVFGVGAFSMAIQVWLGVVGIGLAILLFVVLGNPSAGGAYPAELLPSFWRSIGPWLPPGAATDAIRGIIYFDSAGVTASALVLAGYAVIGVVFTYLGIRRREPEAVEPEAVEAA